MTSLLLVVAVDVLDVYGVVVVGAGVVAAAVQYAVVLGVAGIDIVDKCAPLLFHRLMVNGHYEFALESKDLFKSELFNVTHCVLPVPGRC